MEYKDALEMLKEIRYNVDAMYNGKYVYGHTGNYALDYTVFDSTIRFLQALNDFSIEQYFYALNFSLSSVNELLFLLTMNNQKNNTNKDFCDTIIDETEHFIVTPAVGSIVASYLLIASKRHVTSMSSMNHKEKEDYIILLEKYRLMLYNIHGQYPIVFEHGSNNQLAIKSNSVDHAHTHIVNHQYKNETEMLKNMRFMKADGIDKALDLVSKKDYLFYINNNGDIYYTTDHKPESQIMRKLIANDTNLDKMWDWRDNPFYENIFETLKQVKIKSLDL